MIELYTADSLHQNDFIQIMKSSLTHVHVNHVNFTSLWKTVDLVIHSFIHSFIYLLSQGVQSVIEKIDQSLSINEII